MQRPLVTVLMPAYNAGPYIKAAIDSVLNQTFTDFEFIIINDGSTDESRFIIKSYNDPRIIFIDQSNKGLIASLNHGLDLAKGEWIARFDADDVCHHDRLQLQVEFLDNNPDHILVGSEADYMDKDGNYLFTFKCPAYSYNEIKAYGFKTCPFVHSSVLYKRDAVLSVGGYDDGALTFEDHLLWRKLISKGKMANIDRPLIDVRFNPASVTVDEKWRGPEFNRIKSEVIAKGKINEEEAAKIKEIIKNQDFRRFKEAAYYSMIAKKYLWNQFDPRKARENLRRSIRLFPTKKEGYLLYIMSFLPEKLVKGIYSKFKR